MTKKMSSADAVLAGVHGSPVTNVNISQPIKDFSFEEMMKGKRYWQ